METSADVTGSQTRQIYLAIYPTPPSSKINILRAHWVLWIPSLADPNIGKMIHVTGTPFTGYGLEFKRNATLRGTKACLPFAQVNSRYVADIVSDGKESVDVEARDELEKVAKMVQAPGVSQEPMNLAVGKRSQDWTREYLQELAEKTIVSHEALIVLDQAKAMETA